MKPAYWILAFGILLYSLQYAMFKETGEPRQISLPVAVVR